MDFHEIWYGCFTIGDYSKLVLPNFLSSPVPTWWMLKVVGWYDDDANTHDPLRMRNDASDEVIPRDVCLYAFNH
jgi:hypothetical protein